MIWTPFKTSELILVRFTAYVERMPNNAVENPVPLSQSGV
jgi:hypothetical protein